MARVFAERTLGFTLTFRHVAFDHYVGVGGYQELISQSLRGNQAQRRAQSAARRRIMAFIRSNMSGGSQQCQWVMTDPICRRHVFAGVLVLTQIVRVVRARPKENTNLVAIGQPAALESGIVQTAIAVETQKKTFRDIAAGIHEMMPRSRKTAHIDVCASFYDLLHWRLLARHEDRLDAFLHAFVTGDSSLANRNAKGPRQAETARHQKGYQRQLRAPTIDDHVMANENGKALGLL